MRRADIERGRTWPETATRTVTSIRCGIIYFTEVRHDWRPWNRPASRGRGPSWPSQVQRCQHERATEGRCPTSSRDGDDWRMSGPILRWRGLASSPTHQRCRTSHGQRQRRVPGAAELTIGSPLRPTASAVGATNGTIALAKVTQSGWSGAILARPTDPPLRTKEAGLSRKSAVFRRANEIHNAAHPSRRRLGKEHLRRGSETISASVFLNEAIDRKASSVTSFSVGNWRKPPLLRNSPPALLPGDRGPIRCA